MLVVEQLKNLPQRIQLRRRIEAALEALAEIRTSHPVRKINDHLIDFDFKASAEIVSNAANHLAFPAEERV